MEPDVNETQTDLYGASPQPTSQLRTDAILVAYPPPRHGLPAQGKATSHWSSPERWHSEGFQPSNQDIWMQLQFEFPVLTFFFFKNTPPSPTSANEPSLKHNTSFPSVQDGW